jgi:Na+-driven multidrug efflux pump
MATTTGRAIGVCYQVYRLFKGKGVIKIHLHHYLPDMVVVKSIFKIASTAALQFLIGSASWIALARIVSAFGSEAFAGYTVAVRLVIFFLMPAWGLSNAAATLVGQNLGAKQPERAEQSVWKTARYNGILMGIGSLLFIAFPEFFVGLLNHEPGAVKTGVIALRVMSFGFVFWAVGMVMTNAFNGAGDSKTPTWINFFWFWLFQIPLAYLLADVLKMGPTGVFIMILATEAGVCVTSMILFKKGKWKLVKI